MSPQFRKPGPPFGKQGPKFGRQMMPLFWISDGVMLKMEMLPTWRVLQWSSLEFVSFVNKIFKLKFTVPLKGLYMCQVYKIFSYSF